jgi:CRISPR-associated protein Csm3
MKKLNKKMFIETEVVLKTGLHIGDSKESIEIGGVDNPIVKRKDNLQPYIPGSSLKGKMRCLLEQLYGENPDGKSKKEENSLICDLFGASENRPKKLDGNPSRIIVRDAFLTQKSAEELKKMHNTDTDYTEIKFENVINRVKGVAEHPRQQERVPAGAVFNASFVINIFEGDDEEKLKQLFKKGIELLNDDYLGGSGSRGYGHVEIIIKKESEKTAKEYKVE